MSLKPQEIAGIVVGPLAFFAALLLVWVTMKHRQQRNRHIDTEKFTEKRFSGSSSVPLTQPVTSASLYAPSLYDSESRRTTSRPDSYSDTDSSLSREQDVGSPLASSECIRESWQTTLVGSPKESHYKTYSSSKRPYSICSSDSMSMYSVASAPRELHDLLFQARMSKSRVSSLVEFDAKSAFSIATSTSLDGYAQESSAFSGEPRGTAMRTVRPLPEHGSVPPVPAIPLHLKNVRPLPRPPPVARKPVPYHSLARPAIPPRSQLRPPMEEIRE
ncbi:hypothetical protein VNI00_011748 [Paramarasmius palmivorus]|uniref:Uncharacterized protein n=1 Tax=Paramarasmius palmivorus TaxID=297713 RepID=A0AAW0C9P7_9AGAR